MLTLYDFLDSGNGYKVRLVLCHLGLPFRRVEVDILKGGSHDPAYLARFPNGKIPAVAFDDGRCLWESNAIAWHLAEGSELVPDDPFLRAQVLQWMFFEQYSHEPNIAVARFWQHYVDPAKVDPKQLEQKMKGGNKALKVMDEHLATTPFFVGGAFSVADIALYGYTHVAHEGGFDLAAYPAVQAWLERVAARPGHVLITDDLGETV
ncbi:MAG: glutathione S-transferase family protein [Rhodospirillales bacterium]